MEDNLDLNELQAQINLEVSAALNNINDEISKMRNAILLLKESVSDINQRNMEFIPQIFASYMTLLETEFADRTTHYYEMFKKKVAEAKGGAILDNLSDEPL